MLTMADRGSNPVCSLCPDELVDSEAGHYVLNCVRTPCNHLFHLHCITMWLNKPGMGTCPNCRLKPLYQSDLVPAEKPVLVNSSLQPLHQRTSVPAQQCSLVGSRIQPHHHQRAFVPVPVEHPLLGTLSRYNIQSTIWKWLNSGASILTRCWYFFEDHWEWFLLGVLCSFLFKYAAKKAQGAKAPIQRLPLQKHPIQGIPIQRLPFPKRPVQRFLFLQGLSNRFEKYGFDKIDSWHAY